MGGAFYLGDPRFKMSKRLIQLDYIATLGYDGGNRTHVSCIKYVRCAPVTLKILKTFLELNQSVGFQYMVLRDGTAPSSRLYQSRVLTMYTNAAY